MSAHKRTFLITSGPTREYLDPVRYLSNASSGMMGCALAEAAVRLGHRVIFVTGPATHARPRGARIVPVMSARQMLAQVKKFLPSADVVIGAAAVSDYRPRAFSRGKIAKTGGPRTLALVENPDIIAYAGRRKGSAVVAGFALETGSVVARARQKLRRKNLDLIVANTPSALGGARTSAVLITAAGIIADRKNITKRTLAGDIIRETIKICAGR